jgi:hypothetical protein
VRLPARAHRRFARVYRGPTASTHNQFVLTAATQAHSSGSISVVVSRADAPIGGVRFARDGPVERIVVRVRVARPRGSRLRLELVAPDASAWRLPFRPRATVANGARGCRGAALRFDTNRLWQGRDFLRRWREARGRWTLRARGRGLVTCWQLWVTTGRPSVVRARAGGTSAELESLPNVDGAHHVLIARRGRAALLPRFDCDLCAEQPSLKVRDVDGDRDPEVFAEFWLGGAHCCPVSVVYRHTGGDRYTSSVVVWPGEGVGYRLRDLDGDGVPEFVSASDFECAFVACAGTVDPIRIWDYRGGSFVDVTPRYPELVRREARRYWCEFRASARRNHPLRNVLAAWAADEHSLGRGEAAMRWISYHQPRWYLRALRCLLGEWGYDGSGRCPKVMCGRSAA